MQAVYARYVLAWWSTYFTLKELSKDDLAIFHCLRAICATVIQAARSHGCPHDGDAYGVLDSIGDFHGNRVHNRSYEPHHQEHIYPRLCITFFRVRRGSTWKKGLLSFSCLCANTRLPEKFEIRVPRVMLVANHDAIRTTNHRECAMFPGPEVRLRKRLYLCSFQHCHRPNAACTFLQQVVVVCREYVRAPRAMIAV